MTLPAASLPPPPVSKQRFDGAGSLPTGTVTFFFSDIEGSTRLWEREPDAMRVALARHDTLVRNAIEAHGGMVFKTGGDSFYAAFVTAPDALDAALATLHALQNELWADEAVLRVRIALHTGIAEVRGGDYFGATLSRTARLVSAGHGGQLLVSAATCELLRDQLPDGARLRDLGTCRLKDLERPEHVHQVTHIGLPSDFPPLRSLDNTPNNLPGQPTSFIGREAEMKRVRELLGRTRLLTLTGAGGSGKTRLSLQVAAEVLDDYANGVWLVELAAASEPVAVAQSVATVLRVREQKDQSVTDSVIEYLRSKRLLLLLDNCEHLGATVAQFVATVLRSCPDVKVLTTSREALGIAGETTYRVPSLSLPEPKTFAALGANRLIRYEAVRLFADRAANVKPGFVVSDDNAPAVAGVCYRLDGIPLALELAAARVRSLSVEEIGERLGNRFRLLTTGDRSVLPRQQTLRALVDWSYDLLTGDEKTLFARLSVFAGGFTLSAAETVCEWEPLQDGDGLNLLTGLVDKSLVVAEEGAESCATRYRILESLRQYAAEKLDNADEGMTGRDRHRDYFLHLAETLEPKLRGAEQAATLTRLETEHDNLRSALDGCADCADPSATESCLRLSAALWRFWMVRGYLSEGRDYLVRASTRARETGSAPPALLAKALNRAGVMAHDQGDFAAARTLYEQSLALRRDLGDEPGEASSLNNLGTVERDVGDFAAARARFAESLALYRIHGDKHDVAVSLNNSGNVAHDSGDFAEARSLHEESLALRREIGDKRGIAASLNNLGKVAQEQHVLAEAFVLYEQCLGLLRELGDKQRTASVLNNLGLMACERGDCDRARSLLTESLGLRRELGDKRGVASSLEALAALFLREADARTATMLWASANVLREKIGAPIRPVEHALQAEQHAQARSRLGDTGFDAAWKAGESLDWEAATGYALGKIAPLPL